MEGSFKLAFHDNFTRWERVEVIEKRVSEIVKTRETQRVTLSDRNDNRPRQEAGYDRDMKMASAPSLPMVPTPYKWQKVETSTKFNLEHENQTESGEHSRIVKVLPSVGSQQKLPCVEYQNDLPGVENHKELPCVGN